MKNQNDATTAPTNTSTPKPQGAFTKLIPEIQRAIAEEGYHTPSPIQEQCIVPLLEGKDLLGSAQTGTGKTAAFSLPLLQLMHKSGGVSKKGQPRALILAPTRELAAQIGESVETYGKYLKLKHVVIFGGVSQFHQEKALKRGCDILVATPGRLLDLMQQGILKLNDVDFFILDEVDRMLDMGFIHDIKKVLKQIPADRQTLFFSATMPPKMEQLARTMVKDPVRVTIAPDQPAVERIDQTLMYVSKGNKDKLLIKLLNEKEIKKAIVFTQMKHAANKVVKKLEGVGISSAAIHGNKSQGARTKALAGFKNGSCKVLVATDVAARGIDVDDVTHVFNYDLPVESETYVHRIGRTARAGTDGEAISFCSADEKAYLLEIEKLLRKKVPTDLEQDFHCKDAEHSTQPAPKVGRGGGGGGNRGGGGRPGGPRKGGGHRKKSGGGGGRIVATRKGSGGGRSKPRQGGSGGHSNRGGR